MAAELIGLLSWIHEHPAYQGVRDALQAGLELPVQYMMPRVRPAIIAALIQDLSRPTVVVTPTDEERRRTVEALQLWLPQKSVIQTFPEPPALLYERAPWSQEIITDRLDVLSTLHALRISDEASVEYPPIIVTSARALMRRTLPYRQFRKATRKIAVGVHESLTELTRHASGLGYEPVSVVQGPGELSRRGGLVDIFPPQSSQPYRLEFFGDEIDTIRTFDPATQRSTGLAEGFWLTPVREALPIDGERAIKAIQALLVQNTPAELRGLLEADLACLEAGIPFDNLEFYLPYLYQETGTLLHYLDKKSLLLFTDVEQMEIRWKELEAEAEEQRKIAVHERMITPEAPEPYVSWSAISHVAARAFTLTMTVSEEGPFAEGFRAEPHFAGRLPEALGRIRQWVGLGDQVVVASRQAARMAELWQDFNPPKVYEHLPEAPASLLTFVQCAAPGGWEWSGSEGIRHLLTDEELFGWRPPEARRKSRRRAIAPEQGFADLQAGDYVVHEDYGVGIFQGLVNRSVDDIDREYLMLEFASPHDRSVSLNFGPNGEQASPRKNRHDTLFIPIHQADRLTRYVGAEGIQPHLSRLGGGNWETTKQRVSESATELAGDLLDLYAARQVVEGYAFAPDTRWQKELEASFPYEETQDQIDAIAAVKADMEKARPMDRLICGDAGYGKTEVALRAAFKAVVDNKQVAMLVPTTVLAQQHYETFQHRLSSFPVKVELLSRFRTDAEQDQVLEQLMDGKVDIVIGTHRLLQDDVLFSDLGLVIIDEEQRFGVAHKERLKQIRTQVDVLTLTATPIPRTLYMALTGVRDISIIETPPQERLPISTYVGPYDVDVTRRALTREIKRGGQVFYVHNRVESIHSVAQRLRQLVPDAEIAVAHGKMKERDLSQVMEAFTAGNVDILLATTIIESGLDFPNANTLIVERADRFGLTQLYQLRGRVGRGTRRGYTYFFHKRTMTDEAQERLLALRETTSQGGGFTIALRDLEIRGAGELLGRNQHGHVAAVGFTLYTRILTRAVRRMKAERAGEPLPLDPVGSITIELPLAVGLPPAYVPDDTLRLQLYRRLAELTSAEQIARLGEELNDRFGPIPGMAKNLLYQLNLKVLARDARIPSISVENGQIALRQPWLQGLDPEQSASLRRAIGDLARVGRREIWLPLSWEEMQWRDHLTEVLQRLVRWWENNKLTS